MTTPTFNDLIKTGIVCLILLILYMLILPLWVNSPQRLIIAQIAPVLLVPFSIMVYHWRSIPTWVLGEFAFRPWQLAVSASLLQVEQITFTGKNKLADRSDGLAGFLGRGMHIAEIEVSPTGGNRRYITYKKVSRLFAEKAHRGMSLPLRYQVSRLDPTRLRVRSAL